MAADDRFASFESIRVGDEMRVRRNLLAMRSTTSRSLSATPTRCTLMPPLRRGHDSASEWRTACGRRPMYPALSGHAFRGPERVVSAEFDFLVPVLVDDEIEFAVTVAPQSEATRTLIISVVGTNQHGTLV